MTKRVLFVVVLAAAALFALACDQEKPTDYINWSLEKLEPEQGFSIRIDHGSLPLGGETQTCYFFNAPDLNNGQPYFLARVHTAMSPGSHHLNVFRVNTIIPKDPAHPEQGLDPKDGEPVSVGPGIAGTMIEGGNRYYDQPCWNSANWADWPLLANSQNSSVEDPYTDWEMPENVGIKVTPGEPLMAQLHFVNYGQQLTEYGIHLGINFHRYPSDATPQEMGSLFATQQSIRICQSTPEVTFSGTCRFPLGTHVMISAANGHFHSRGKQFRVYTWDGLTVDHPPDDQMFYESRDWNEPPMLTDLELPAPDDGGVWWDCQYQWQQPIGDSLQNGNATCDDVNAKDPDQQGDCCYTFGGNVDVGEHCNLFLYFYPRVDNQDIFCN